MEHLDLGGDLTYSERPIKILDSTERVTRRRTKSILPQIIPKRFLNLMVEIPLRGVGL
jgi:hypothetical protein